jgi:hypothetical protein
VGNVKSSEIGLKVTFSVPQLQLGVSFDLLRRWWPLHQTKLEFGASLSCGLKRNAVGREIRNNSNKLNKQENQFIYF